MTPCVKKEISAFDLYLWNVNRIKPDNLTVSDAQESVCDSAFGQASASKG